MAKLLKCTNHVVTAIVTTGDYERAKRERKAPTSLLKVSPVFTFSNAPYMREWVTGTLEDMERICAGHEVRRAHFYVPFSNGLQWGDPTDPEVKSELYLRPTLGEVMDTFGLVPKRAEVADG